MLLPGRRGSGVRTWVGWGVMPCRQRDHRSDPAEGPCPRRAESRAAFIPLLCYGCRLTFKELVRLSGRSAGALRGVPRDRGGVPRDRGVPIPTVPLLQGPLATLPPYIRAEARRRICG